MTLVNTVMRFLLCMPSCFSHVQLFDTMDCGSPGSSVHGDSPGNTGVGCHVLLQGIFPSQGSNPCLLHLLQVDCLPTEPPRKSEVSICPYHFYSLSCHLFPSDGKHFPDILSKSVLHILQWLGKISIV